MFVVFGRPGAGKSTIAQRSKEIISNQNMMKNILYLDLDVCIPKWMKDNFSQGIYPTLSQRKEFALSASHYVTTQRSKHDNPIAIISFSFVNNDLREIFREHFPNAVWILIDTNENVALQRICARNDHFYKGNPSRDTVHVKKIKDDLSNMEWKFAPIHFDHKVLDGLKDIDHNAYQLMQIILDNNDPM